SISNAPDFKVHQMGRDSVEPFPANKRRFPRCLPIGDKRRQTRCVPHLMAYRQEWPMEPFASL
ncbi:hypothetical protein N8633_02825, partial [bacterium]|nr:hypothetical protein [bacterium]